MFMDRVTCRESCKRHMAVSGKVRRGKWGFSAMGNDICTCTCATIRLLCSFEVPELLKSALVLVLVVLVLVLLLLLVVVVVVAVATHLIFAFLWALKNCHAGAVFFFAFFDILGAKTP